MRPSLRALRSRASDRARRAAEGAGSPAGQEPVPPADAGTPGAVERGTMRRRMRRARRMRETLMTELGALVMEMHRQHRHDPALVERKAREALVADREASGLARALGAGQGVHAVVAAGIAGGCYACGALLATDDRFCSRCGARSVAALNGGAVSAPPPGASPAPPPGAVQAPPPDPGTRTPAPTAAPPDPSALAPPPDPQARVAPPPDPATRVPAAPAPASPSAAPPPPDPSTRVPPSEEADTVQIANPTRQQ
jgi:hypothetical protein